MLALFVLVLQFGFGLEPKSNIVLGFGLVAIAAVINIVRYIDKEAK